MIKIQQFKMADGSLHPEKWFVVKKASPATNYFSDRYLQQNGNWSDRCINDESPTGGYFESREAAEEVLVRIGMNESFTTV